MTSILTEAAGLVVNCLVGPVNNLCTAACSTIMSVKDNIDSLEHEVQELQCRKERMVKELENAEMDGKVPAPDVIHWIKNAEKLPGKAKNVEDDFKKLSKCVGDCSPNVVSSYQLSKRAERLLKDVKELKDKNFQEIATKPAAGDSMGWPAGSIVGRRSELMQLQKLFADGNISTIGIYGMAGVGKTALLEKFCTDFHGKGTYHIYWVDMGRCLNVEDAQNAIVEELGLNLNENEKDTKAKRRRIFSFLQNRNFVLALDNVWKPLKLNEVGIPSAEEGKYKFKVILTTQLEDVCDQMEAKKLEMKCLGQGTAWTLFWQIVGDSVIYSDPWITNDALQLVKKCAGLPLALVTLGRSMKCKRTSKSWSLAIKQLDFAPWEIKHMEEELLRSLKPSYDNLADEKLKTCFLYCCLFPAGSLIYEERIICYCIGEGIIRDPFEDATDMFDLGHELLYSLKASSLLEESSDDDSYFKMHPIIRALPLLMECELGAKEKWLVRTQLELTEAPDIEKWRVAERISLMNNSINALHEIPDSPSLSTLLMSHNKELENICEGFFRSMRKLRVLDLSYTSISKVPTEIGKLVGLLYLDFSNTKLMSLPREMENLVRLRALLLSRTPELKIIPHGLIAKLSELRLLSMYVSYENWKVDSVGDGVDFRELNSLKQLKVLGISLNTVSVLHKLAESNRLSKSVRELEIRLSHDLKTLSTATNIRYKALKCLRLSSCIDLKELEICSPLPNLTELYLMQLPITKMTCQSGCLENLSRIEITNCKEIRHLISCDKGPEVKENRSEEEKKDRSHRKTPIYGDKRQWIRYEDYDDDDDDEAFKEGPNEKEKRPEEKEKGPEEEDKVPRQRKIPNYGEKRQWIRYEDYDDDEANKQGSEEKEKRPEEKETGSSGINILPKLRQLKLSHLPELESLSYGERPLAFPSLETLDVKECFKLKKIPLNAVRLRQIRGQRSWWNGLEWPDDNRSRSKFQSYFKAIYPELMGWET